MRLSIKNEVYNFSKGVTLIELLIASSIFLVVMITIFSAFHTGVFGYRSIDDTLTINQTARLALERIDLDLRNLFAYASDKTAFTGTKNAISFLALVDTFTKDRITSDFSFVSYSLQDKKIMRLCRKNRDSFDNAADIQPEEMASDVEAFEFHYGYQSAPEEPVKFDKDLWDDPAKLPVAVKIKLSLKNTLSQDFERTIYLAAEQ